MADQIKTSLSQSGFRCKVVSIDYSAELQNELQSLQASGSLDEVLCQEYLSSFEFQPPENLPGAKSIIIVATPQPILSLIFNWKGEARAVLIPPTYNWKINEEIKRKLEEVLSPECYSIAPARLPLKLLAMHSGLTKYGRNNISYVPGMGSFFRLHAFYTDLPTPPVEWLAEPVELQRCLKCTICIKECPTGAIGEDRFLLRAERCLTYHNENIRDFPDYVEPSFHNCLVGCLLCQRSCPENRKVKDWVEERERFSGEETKHILSDIPPEELTPATRVKLERMCLLDDMPLVRRNLRLLLT